MSGQHQPERTNEYMPRNLCNCPNCQTDNCPAAEDHAETVAALEASKRSSVGSMRWLESLTKRLVRISIRLHPNTGTMSNREACEALDLIREEARAERVRLSNVLSSATAGGKPS